MTWHHGLCVELLRCTDRMPVLCQHGQPYSPFRLQCSSHLPDFYCPQLGDEVAYVAAGHAA